MSIIIPIIIIIACLVIIASIVFKKFPYLIALDVSKISKEQEAETKHKILSDRVIRKTKAVSDKGKSLFDPFFNRLQKWFTSVYNKVKNLDTKQQSQMSFKKEPEVIRKRTTSLLSEAQEFYSKEKYHDAENKCIEVISLDSKNIEAYKILGNVYRNTKDYLLAKQTFQHLIKLDSSIIDAYIDLSEILKELGKGKQALDIIIKALDKEPNNPKNLDAAISMAIHIEDLHTAKEMLNRLKKANSENQKLAEWEEEIKEKKKKAK